MHANGDWEQFRQAGRVSNNAGGVGVEKLDIPYVLFGGSARAKGMPDEVPGNATECLLEVEKGHVYWLVLPRHE